MDTTGGAAAAVGASGLSEEEEKARLAAIVNNLESRDALRMYRWLSQRCFSECVTTFYRKALGRSEGDCVRACVRKFLLVRAASDARFRELADPASASADDE